MLLTLIMYDFVTCLDKNANLYRLWACLQLMNVMNEFGIYNFFEEVTWVKCLP